MTCRAYTTNDEPTVNAALAFIPRQAVTDLERYLLEIEGWATVLTHLGGNSDPIDPQAVAVIGHTLDRCVEYLRHDWRDALAAPVGAGV